MNNFIGQVHKGWSGTFAFRNVREPQSVWGTLNPIYVKINVIPDDKNPHYVIKAYIKKVGTAAVDPNPKTEIVALLETESFFELPSYIANTGTRDGSLLIVTAQRGDAQHEVWYQNISTKLTEKLWAIRSEIDPNERSLTKLLDNMQRLNKKLEDE